MEMTDVSKKLEAIKYIKESIKAILKEYGFDAGDEFRDYPQYVKTMVETVRQKGLDEGYSDGYKEAEGIFYDRGLEDGFNKSRDVEHERGYNEGYAKASAHFERESAKAIKNAYDEGYRDASDGDDSKLSEIRATAYEEGRKKGVAEGFAKGMNDLSNNSKNYNNGLEEGKKIGHKIGYNEGTTHMRNDHAFTDSIFADGVKAGKEEMAGAVKESYNKGREDAKQEWYDKGYGAGHSDATLKAEKEKVAEIERSFENGRKSVMEECDRKISDSKKEWMDKGRKQAEDKMLASTKTAYDEGVIKGRAECKAEYDVIISNVQKEWWDKGYDQSQKDCEAKMTDALIQSNNKFYNQGYSAAIREMKETASSCEAEYERGKNDASRIKDEEYAPKLIESFERGREESNQENQKAISALEERCREIETKSYEDGRRSRDQEIKDLKADSESRIKDYYKRGYKKGYLDSKAKYDKPHGDLNTDTKALSDAFSYGTDEGFRKGYSNGVNGGYLRGEHEGYSKGYAQGKTDGFRDGEKYGFERGMRQGMAYAEERR